MKHILLSFIILFSIPTFAQDLTGTWKGNKGGTFYIRQNSNDIWWFGDGGTDWNHVFHGEIHGDLIFGDWADVPSGEKRNSGSLTIKIVSNDELTREWTSGNNLNTKWTRYEESGSQGDDCCKRGVQGKWDTNYGEMILKQEGNRVWGTYTHKNGNVEGTLDCNVLTGTWKQDNGSGELIFTFHTNCTKFSSRYSEKGTWHTDWKGERE